ncbi:Zn(II)2Cys6 transcription factor [Aspergillus mulundensis]|uniref:Zn(2)-C6 fungal-type domain-containing protein n=1 Tax=Aspergillus mulundensis TaxID=1810919 RepID=A0A3D8QJD9_9EURO|nr:hypothetical protein DSM5745_10503 [Aspergillus mulundensis]RDW61831.1 hypothetical protein DSM5745_10503 [Aspergillus mulundensis]
MPASPPTQRAASRTRGSANRVSKTAKACQQCRTRKSRCDGKSPCMPCQQRGQESDCRFRDFVRRRRAKTASTTTLSPGEPGIVEASSDNANALLQGDDQAQFPHARLTVFQQGQQENGSSIPRPNTTSRHRGTVDLYYGPTSDFSLAQHLRRDLFGNASESAVGEAGHDRALFLGLPAAESALLNSYSHAPGSNLAGEMLALIPYDVAKELLERYLETHYAYAPFLPAEFYRGLLDELYDAHMHVQGIPSNNINGHRSQRQNQSYTHIRKKQNLLLLAIALAAQATEKWEWGETLFRSVKRDHFEDTGLASLESIQLYAQFETEAGRPNYAYLAIGHAAREAFLAGLHKEALRKNWRRGVSPVDVSARRVTFWILYFHESWISFCTGRPSCFEAVDIETPLPDNPFLALLTDYARLMGAITDRIYKPKHSAIANLWREACILSEQLSSLRTKVQDMFGVDWESVERNSSHGPREVFLVMAHCKHPVLNHMTLLTYRPLVIFRSRWKRDEDRLNRAQANPQTRPRPECTTYLREGCNHALNAAVSTIRYLSALGIQNSKIKDIRTHSLLLTHTLLLLLYDFIHDATHPPSHLHWIHTALRFLARMRHGEPVASVISAARGMLRRVNPGFDLDPFDESQAQARAQAQGSFDGFEGVDADGSCFAWALSTPTPDALGGLDGGGCPVGTGEGGTGGPGPGLFGGGEGDGNGIGECNWGGGAAFELNQDLASLDMDAFFTFPFDDFLVDEGSGLGLGIP